MWPSLLDHPLAGRRPGFRVWLVVSVPIVCGAWRIQKVTASHHHHVSIDEHDIMALPVRDHFHGAKCTSWAVRCRVHVFPRRHQPLAHKAALVRLTVGPPSRICNRVHFAWGQHPGFRAGSFDTGQSKVSGKRIDRTRPTLAHQAAAIIEVAAKATLHGRLRDYKATLCNVARTVP